MSALGDFLEHQMNMRGWEQKDLAAYTNIRPSTVSRLLNDKVDEPQLSTLWSLSQTLNVPLGYLVELSGYSIHQLPNEELRNQFLVLVDSFPWIVPIVEILVALPAKEREAVIVLLKSLGGGIKNDR